jgi:hypothetical protein
LSPTTPVPNTFTGEVNWVEIDVGNAADDADHRIDPTSSSGWRWRGSRPAGGAYALTTQRKPMWPVEVSTASPWRAAGR